MSYLSQSFFRNTQTTNNIRDYLVPINLSKDPRTDKEFIITKDFENRPGLLAQELYGSPRYNWVFAYYNRSLIKDSLVDMVEGLTIIIPDPNRVIR